MPPVDPTTLGLKSRSVRLVCGWCAQLRRFLGCNDGISPPDFEDEATLYSLSSEYLEAANVLYNSPPTRIGYALSTYYLAGHAAELMLKSFLFKHGESIKTLKRYGHDLKSLVKRARKKGLPVNVSIEHIKSFAETYEHKHTEYRQKQSLSFPPLDLLLQEIVRLQSHVFSHVAEF